jgi:two-component system response regulator
MTAAPNPVDILLVEDSDEDAELTIRSLRRKHITNNLQRALDGADALEILFGAQQAAPKLVLLDLKLPKVDGLEVLRRIKSEPRTQAIPVVVLTSSREESDLVESYRLGVNSYIVKPVDFDKFAEAVAQLGLYWTLLNESPS